MDRLRTLCAAVVIATLPLWLVSCGGGGSSPIDEVLGVVAEKGKSESKKDGHSSDKDDSKKDGDEDSADDHDDSGVKDGGRSDDQENSKKDNDDHSADDDAGNSVSANPASPAGGNAGGNNNSGSQVDNSNKGEGTHSPSNDNQVMDTMTDLPISIASNTQQQSIVVYQPGERRSLVVWNDLRNRNGFDYYGWAVYGQLVNSSGQFHGENFKISPFGVEYRSTPRMAHDATTGRTLVVWGTTGGDIQGQMLNSDGTFYGEVLSIASSTNNEGYPALAFNPVQGRFLVTWLGYQEDNYVIHGRLLNREGVSVGTSIVISEAVSGKLELQAQADTQGGGFLVVWRDYRGVDTYSIRGQMVNSDGSLRGTEINIADAIGSQILPALAYDPANHCFLVTWSDDRRYGGAAYEIYGQLVAEDGVLVGSNFLISSYGGYPHSLAFDSSRTSYLLTFSKFGSRIHGQYLAADGIVEGEPFAVSDIEGIQSSPHLDYDANQERFMMVWTDRRNGSDDIYGHTVSNMSSEESCNDQNAQGCLACETDPPAGEAGAGALVDQACPVDGTYANHGEYMDCVTKKVKQLRKEGLIGPACSLKLIDPRARSGVGSP